MPVITPTPPGIVGNTYADLRASIDANLNALNEGINANTLNKASLASPALTGVPTVPTATLDTNTPQAASCEFVLNQASDVPPLMNGVSAVGTDERWSRGDHKHPVDTSRAPLASPAFTGTVTGISKAMVGLGNVDNTTDATKPVSTPQQTALNLKANLASPTFTGTVAGVTKSMVDLGNCDNTSDANKPISTATQTALNLKAPLDSPSFEGFPAAPTQDLLNYSDNLATTKFVKDSIDANKNSDNDIAVVSAFASIATSIPSTSDAIASTIVKFDTKLFDTNNFWDVVNYKFLPNIPGYYLISVHVTLSANLDKISLAVSINGTLYKYLKRYALGQKSICGSAVIYLDGVDDYAQINIGSGDSANTAYGQTLTHFSCSLLKSI